MQIYTFRERESERNGGYPSNEVRRTDEAFGTPERVIKVSSMPFELSGKAAINNSTATAFFEEIRHQSCRRAFRVSRFHVVNEDDQEGRLRRLSERRRAASTPVVAQKKLEVPS